MNLSYPVCSQLIRSSWYYWLQLHSAMPLDMSCLMYHLQLSQYLSHTPLKVKIFEEKASFTNFISILHLLAWWKSFWTYLWVCAYMCLSTFYFIFLFLSMRVTMFWCKSSASYVQVERTVSSCHFTNQIGCSAAGALLLVKIKILLWFLTASLAWWWQCCGLIFVGTHWCIWSTMCA